LLEKNLKRRDHLEDPVIDRIILKWILWKYDGWVLIEYIWPRTGTGSGMNR
jgi:hypothetical protein